MSTDDVAYFTRRLDEERQRAASTQAEIASTHSKFASHYEQALASAGAGAEPGAPAIGCSFAEGEDRR